MALTWTARGTVVNETSSTTFAISPTSDFAAGSIAVLAISIDNSGTNGADPYSSIADTNSNTWASRVVALNDPGARNDGVVVRLFDTDQSGGQITTSTVITVTLTDSTDAKTAVLWQVSGDAGTPTYTASGTATGTSTTPSVTTASITSGDAIVGVVGVEHNGAVTADSDTSNGSWSSQQTAVTTTFTGVAHIRTASQTKVVTGTATQTYNPTLGTSRDWAILWAQYTEVAPTSIHNHLESRKLGRPSKVIA